MSSSGIVTRFFITFAGCFAEQSNLGKGCIFLTAQELLDLARSNPEGPSIRINVICAWVPWENHYTMSARNAMLTAQYALERLGCNSDSTITELVRAGSQKGFRIDLDG